jgi:hypothetical protein
MIINKGGSGIPQEGDALSDLPLRRLDGWHWICSRDVGNKALSVLLAV